MMKFSIVTPSFNHGRYISEVLESVFLQASHDFHIEHLVIDGGSSDHTKAILQHWKESHNHPCYSFSFISEADDGMTDAINKGFRRSTGDWIMWLNADDYLLGGSLGNVAAFAKENHETEVIYGDCLFVDENGALIRQKRELDFDFNMLLFYGCYIQSTACFYKGSLITNGKLLDPTYKVTMDFEYYLRLAQSGARFSHIPRTLAAFRWHGDNMSTRLRAERLAERQRAQYAALEREGLSCFAHPWLLKVLFRWQQIIRMFQRCTGQR